ncbi:MAG: NAD(P)-dependent oxidoreductase [Alphaproteobacteria bacterium]|nr:NAD(P)-dependent oxidoreductase [Alphaproteobacteria bacterium]
MRILFTGASSFTGFWFVRELAASGHRVVAAFRGDGRYDGIRAERTRLLRECCEPRFGCAFGSDAFLDLVRSEAGAFDVLCHHGAEVGDYRSPDFDPYRAAALNLYRLPEAMRALKERGCARLVLTGSVFEQQEGAGSAPARAFSPYGLSKGLTAAAAAFYAEREGFTFEKFVIPNPFGPYEEPRFTSYLMRSWLKGETARVQTPRYVRDNVPVGLLARAYAGFVAGPPQSAPEPGAVRRLNPSFYPESQGAFAERVRREAAARLGLPCGLELGEQRDFPEPAVRINTDLLDPDALGWNEAEAWDAFVAFYADKAARPG